jgi:hypothetical protein
MHNEERREYEPKFPISKVTLVLSEDEPQQKTGPTEESNPPKRNYYAYFRRHDNHSTDDQQANYGDSNQLGSLQDEADEAPTLAVVSSCSIHLMTGETVYRRGIVYCKQAISFMDV